MFSRPRYCTLPAPNRFKHACMARPLRFSPSLFDFSYYFWRATTIRFPYVWVNETFLITVGFLFTVRFTTISRSATNWRSKMSVKVTSQSNLKIRFIFRLIIIYLCLATDEYYVPLCSVTNLRTALLEFSCNNICVSEIFISNQSQNLVYFPTDHHPLLGNGRFLC